MKTETLPLGVDLGSKRVRVALLEREPRRAPRLVAVAARDHAGDPAGTLAEMVTELRTREQRCVLALAPPDALLTAVNFPPMSHWERRRAARFEAARLIDFPVEQALVSVVAAGERCWALGVARRAALTAAIRVVKTAKLRLTAVDSVALALRRAFPDADAVIDVGETAARVMVCESPVPHVACVPIGGEALTGAIAQSLGIETIAAEQRKRNIGFAGAGETRRDELVTAISAILTEARIAREHAFARIVLCGNGSRVPGLGEAVERAGDCRVYAATLPPEISETIPADILRAAAADWSLAYGLGLWSSAA